MCYSGMEIESVTETIVRIYKQLKTKTSQSIPPDKNSVLSNQTNSVPIILLTAIRYCCGSRN